MNDTFRTDVADALIGGLSLREVMTKFGVTKSYVMKRRRETICNIPVQQPRPTKRQREVNACSKQDIALITAYYRDHTIKETAARFNMRAESVSKLAKMGGFYKRPGPRSPSTVLLESLGLRIVTKSNPDPASSLCRYFMVHNRTSKRLPLSKTEAAKIRRNAAPWLQANADRLNAAFK